MESATAKDGTKKVINQFINKHSKLGGMIGIGPHRAPSWLSHRMKRVILFSVFVLAYLLVLHWSFGTKDNGLDHMEGMYDIEGLEEEFRQGKRRTKLKPFGRPRPPTKPSQSDNSVAYEGDVSEELDSRPHFSRPLTKSVDDANPLAAGLKAGIVNPAGREPVQPADAVSRIADQQIKSDTRQSDNVKEYSPPIPPPRTDQAAPPAANQPFAGRQTVKRPQLPPQYEVALKSPKFPVPPPKKYGSGKGYPDPEGMKQAKMMMRHAWDNYVKYAWGKDDLKPISKEGLSWLGDYGLAATLIDSLDTLWIMGMKEEFQKARYFVANQLDFNQPMSVSVFETIIRVVGGLNSAYDLTGDKLFLKKSIEIADRLMPAFSTGTGIPYTWLTLNSGSGSMYGQGAVLAEYGSTQIEFQYLSDVTGDPKYAKASVGVMDYILKKDTPVRGLYPTYIDAYSGTWRGGSYTLGAMADSFYEYILKFWLYSDKSKDFYRDKYDESAHAVEKYLIRKTENGDLYLGSGSESYVNDEMEHLACFAAGMYALGAATKRDRGDWQHMMEIGANLTETCYKMYHTQPFGIGAEKTSIPDWRPTSNYYILRPEVVESIFYMWRLTHDEKYRQWGSEIMNSLEKYCRVDSGYSGLNNVNSAQPNHNDRQESFFLAETLKYLYLLFTDDDVLPLEEYVFNTEAHPVRSRKYQKFSN